MQKISDLITLIWEKYRLEVVFSSLSLLILIISIIIYFNNSPSNNSESFTLEEENQNFKTKSNYTLQKFTIDLSGAVIQPDVYEVTPGARLKDVINLAKGLASDADRDFFSRNFNLARLVKDQEKIHIPSRYEISLGVYKEPARLVDFTQPQLVNYQNTDIASPTIQSSILKLSINKADLNELDELPGIGAVTAQKIINNRPYSSIEELLKKKILKSNIYDKIKDQISTN